MVVGPIYIGKSIKIKELEKHPFLSLGLNEQSATNTNTPRDVFYFEDSRDARSTNREQSMGARS